VHLLGGSLNGKRALDLGCNAGFWLRHERLEEPRHAIDHELVMYPTWEGVDELVRQFRYFVGTLKPRFEGYAGARFKQRVRKHERQLQSMQASKTWKLLNKLASGLEYRA